MKNKKHLSLVTAGRDKTKATMTQEEFKERLTALVDKKNAIKQEIKKLQNEYLASYPIQPGDKCINENDVQCWLSRIVFKNINPARPLFLVNYPKMDGTRSKQEEYCFSKLTKVDKKELEDKQ